MVILRATGIEAEREVPSVDFAAITAPGARPDRRATGPAQADALAAALALPPSRPRRSIRPGSVHDRRRGAEPALPVRRRGPGRRRRRRPAPGRRAVGERPRVRRAAGWRPIPFVVLFGVRSPEGDQAGRRPADAHGVRGWISTRRGTLIADVRGRRSDRRGALQLLHRATAGNPLALLELGAADLDVHSRAWRRGHAAPSAARGDRRVRPAAGATWTPSAGQCCSSPPSAARTSGSSPTRAARSDSTSGASKRPRTGA